MKEKLLFFLSGFIKNVNARIGENVLYKDMGGREDYEEKITE